MNRVPTQDTSAKKRLIALMLFCFVLAGAVLVRATYIQLIDNPRLEAMARRQFQAKMLVRPRRGPILDRTGQPLAVNKETHSLAANPAKIKNRRTLARLLARATDVPGAKLLQRLDGKREFVWIKRHLSTNEIARLKKLRLMDSEGDLVEGLWLVKESERAYPHNELAAHVLGDVNVDADGLEGVELWMNDKLRGKVVSVSAVKDALGRPTFIDADAAKHVQDGEPVSLTIDSSLQFAVEQELKGSLHRTGSKSGSVIVMNAANGEILAMANQPSFNPNEKGAPADRHRNRAVTDGFEPGSTMKSILIASALSHGWKMTDQVWGERGQFKVQGKKISEAEAHEKFEWIDLKKILMVSSNVGAAKVALRLGADHYSNALKAFGFGARTGVGFPGEIPGRVPPRKDWQDLTLANIGFGQGLLVTPLQMVRAYAALLNGGLLVQPVLIRQDQKQDQKPGDPKPESPKRVISQKVADQVVDALVGVTQPGFTGAKAALPGYVIAGKTGTAQMVDSQTGTYSRTQYNTSFIGFAVGVEPKLVVFTSLSEPKGNYYATETAAPLFRDVMAAVASRFSLPTRPDGTRILAQNAARSADQIRTARAHAEPVSVKPEPVPILIPEGTLASTGKATWRLPSLKGLSPREAMRVLRGHALKLEMSGLGVVSNQVPEAGRVVSDGDTIRLTLTENL